MKVQCETFKKQSEKSSMRGERERANEIAKNQTKVQGRVAN